MILQNVIYYYFSYSWSYHYNILIIFCFGIPLFKNFTETKTLRWLLCGPFFLDDRSPQLLIIILKSPISAQSTWTFYCIILSLLLFFLLFFSFLFAEIFQSQITTPFKLKRIQVSVITPFLILIDMEDTKLVISCVNMMEHSSSWCILPGRNFEEKTPSLSHTWRKNLPTNMDHHEFLF